VLAAIFEDDWLCGQGLPKDEFVGASTPFPHGSVRKRRIDHVETKDTPAPVPYAEARVVMLNSSDAGDGLHGGPYLVGPGFRCRPGIAREIPLPEFDYQKALATGWFSAEEGMTLVRESNAFDCDRYWGLSNEEIGYEARKAISRLIISALSLPPGKEREAPKLVLWLRAHREWQRLGVPPHDRPNNGLPFKFAKSTTVSKQSAS
jgi:hypothetical protein